MRQNRLAADESRKLHDGEWRVNATGASHGMM
jgi:hypothetical protein